jgi:hypothetical protein
VDFNQSPTKWNPRFIAYCIDTGQPDPDAALARDRRTFPGGCMFPFTQWIQARWFEWNVINGWPHGQPHGPDQHYSFDQWLKQRATPS